MQTKVSAYTKADGAYVHEHTRRVKGFGDAAMSTPEH